MRKAGLYAEINRTGLCAGHGSYDESANLGKTMGLGKTMDALPQEDDLQACPCMAVSYG